jgi:hypothetical protein
LKCSVVEEAASLFDNLSPSAFCKGGWYVLDAERGLAGRDLYLPRYTVNVDGNGGIDASKDINCPRRNFGDVTL